MLRAFFSKGTRHEAVEPEASGGPKIVALLVAGKSRRFIKEHLNIGSGRFKQIKALAREHGYLDGRALPAYPEALFPDRADRRREQSSDIDARLLAHRAWLEERLRSGWHAITVFEELGARPDVAVAPGLTQKRGEVVAFEEAIEAGAPGQA